MLCRSDYNINLIRSFIYTFDGLDLEVNYIRDLKDINNNVSFSLYQVDENGYAILTKNNSNIVEISYGNFPGDDKMYYVGAGDFKISLIDYANNQLMTVEDNYSNDNENIIQATEAILNEKVVFQYDNSTGISLLSTRPYPSKPSVISGGVEVGITDSNMDIFNGSVWINYGNQCGAYAAAVMITYMDKYHGGKYFKESGSYSSGAIIERLKEDITGMSSANTLVYAMNRIFLEDYPSGGKHGTVTSSETTYKNKIANSYPVCLLLQSTKQSPYGNHWVCAYKYVDYNGALWFKAHDNWAGNNHRGWINRNWIYNGVYTN